MAAGMKPIWYFVGWILVTTGVLVILGGVSDELGLTSSDVRLGSTYANFWWGAVMVIVGIVYIRANRNKYVSHDV
jgi:hypothetical protein